MKSVLISIQPYWVFLIIAKAMGWNTDRQKKVEVRKDFPKDKAWGGVVEIYCSKDKRSFRQIPKEYQTAIEPLLGKVVGEFVCNGFDEFTPTDIGVKFKRFSALFDTCLSLAQLRDYLGKKKGYGWRISNLNVYDTPMPLWRFMKCGAPTEDELGDELCSSCEETEWGTRAVYGTPSGPVMCEGAFCGRAYGLYLDEHFALKRPPQSWCYVEELKTNG